MELSMENFDNMISMILSSDKGSRSLSIQYLENLISSKKFEIISELQNKFEKKIALINQDEFSSEISTDIESFDWLLKGAKHFNHN